MGSGYLNVRSGAATGSGIVGETVEGSQGTTNVWYRLRSGMYVSKAWVAGGTVAAC